MEDWCFVCNFACVGKSQGSVMDIREKVMSSTKISEFQRKVYLELLNVPRGETISYGELARRVGCGSAQAVGQALKKNPFAPEVPCHRVVSSLWEKSEGKAKGSIGGFFGQRDGEMVELKRQLLEEEQAGTSNIHNP